MIESGSNCSKAETHPSISLSADGTLRIWDVRLSETPLLTAALTDGRPLDGLAVSRLGTIAL